MDDTAGSWRAFWHAPPGRRFIDRHDRLKGVARGSLRRILRAVLGILLIAVGLVFLPLPGPGFVPLLFGAAVLAGESARMARWLDGAELRVRRWLGR